jgi:hypothetical protein
MACTQVKLMREKHIHYAAQGLRRLSGGFVCLDAR